MSQFIVLIFWGKFCFWSFTFSWRYNVLTVSSDSGPASSSSFLCSFIRFYWVNSLFAFDSLVMAPPSNMSNSQLPEWPSIETVIFNFQKSSRSFLCAIRARYSSLKALVLSARVLQESVQITSRPAGVSVLARLELLHQNNNHFQTNSSYLKHFRWLFQPLKPASILSLKWEKATFIFLHLWQL